MTASPLTYARFKASDATNGTLDVYEAGSLQNRKTTYSDPDLSVQNTNPVQLNSLGEADVFYTGLARLVLKDESGAQIWDKDDIGVASDVSGEWINSLSATYASSTTFTISGDQTTEYHVNRRVRLTGSSTAYGRITVSSYSNPSTTITVVLTSGSLDATLATVATSVISGDSSSGVFFSHIQGSDVASASTVVLNTLIGDFCHITGTTPITAITLTKGREITVVFDGALILTNGASLILPGGANITTAAGDTCLLRGEASGVVRCIDYTPKKTYLSDISGYVSGTRTYIKTDPTITSTGFSVDSAVASGGAFESVGPTGAGADNTWTQLDTLPAGTRIAIVVCNQTAVTDGTDRSSSVITYVRMTGASTAINASQIVGNLTFPNDDYTSTGASSTQETLIPLDANRKFDVTWAKSNTTTQSSTLYLRGFIV